MKKYVIFRKIHQGLCVAYTIEILIWAPIRWGAILFSFICILFLGPSTGESNERIKTLPPSIEYWHGDCHSAVCNISYFRIYVFPRWYQRQHNFKSSPRCVVGRQEFVNRICIFYKYNLLVFYDKSIFLVLWFKHLKSLLWFLYLCNLNFFIIFRGDHLILQIFAAYF